MSRTKIVAYEDISHWDTHQELEPLVAAADFAAIKHKSHFNLNDESGTPYINHVICKCNNTSKLWLSVSFVSTKLIDFLRSHLLSKCY